MRNFFRTWNVGLVILFLICAVEAAGAEPAPRRILATTFPIYQILRQVTDGVPGVQTDVMIPAGAGCPHDYALTPRDIRKLTEADILAINGLGLEAFLSTNPAKINPRLAVADASRGLGDLLPADGGQPHAAHAGHDAEAFNPHLFGSPRRMAAMTVGLGNQLAELDPDHAALYRENAHNYALRMHRLADEFTELGKRLANRRIVTQHGVFDYLARDMGLEVAAVLQAGEDQQPSAADMLRLIREIREKQIGAVFTEPQYPDKIASTVAREAGVPAARLDPVAGGPPDAPPDYYETVMRGNLRTLERTLGTR